MDRVESQGHQASSSEFEVDSQDLHLQSKLKTVRLLDGARVGLTILALCAGVTILGVSGDALAVYDATHVPAEFLLPLWPDQFDLRPTVALVAGSAVIVVTSILALLSTKVQSIRSRAAIHTPIMFMAPLFGFIAAIVAMAYFYHVNASTTVDTLQSWTCRWSDVYMVTRPHFGTLCKESRAGLYLSILLVPVEALALGVAGYQFAVERHLGSLPHGGARAKSVSPVPVKTERPGTAY